MAAVTLTPERAAAEIARRAELAKAEIARRLQTLDGQLSHASFVENDLYARLHPKQRMVVDLVDRGCRFIAAECSRRAGKTHLSASLVLRKLVRAKRGQEVVFCAPTLARGKELIWQELVGLIEEYRLPWRTNEHSGKVYTTAGAMFRIVGLNIQKQVGRLGRGGNTILFVTDETQEYPQLLQQLMIAVGPALAQSRGVFLAMGTPTVNEADYWAQICDGAEGFQRVHWSLLDNPFLGRPPEEILAEERERNGWSEDHPTYVREYLGRRCKDPSNLVLEFDKAKNVVTKIDGFDPVAWSLVDGVHSTRPEHVAMRARWRFFIGIDFGLRDTTAWVVLCASMFNKRVFVVHCEQEAGLDWDEVALRTKRLSDTWKPRAIVGDSASGGAQFMQTFNARYGSVAGVRARVAAKHDKKASIEVMNTELRKERFVFLSPVTDQLVKEATALQWANPERTEILEGSAYPEDLFDATHYAFREFRAWLHKQEEKQKTPEQLEQERVEARNKREHQKQSRGYARSAF